MNRSLCNLLIRSSIQSSDFPSTNDICYRVTSISMFIMCTLALELWSYFPTSDVIVSINHSVVLCYSTIMCWTPLRSYQNPSPENKPRLWWCPTGILSFLPLHAAGLYSRGAPPGSKLSDFVVSSYIPTLSSLIDSTAHSPPPSVAQPKLLAV